MGKRLNNWTVYLDRCKTIAVKKSRILDFIFMTEVLMAIRYNRDVDWLDSAAMDLLL